MTPILPEKVPKAVDKTDDLISNPDYDAWVAKDQQVLNYLFSSMYREILSHVATLSTVVAVWEAIEAMFTSQSCARVINTRMELATT